MDLFDQVRQAIRNGRWLRLTAAPILAATILMGAALSTADRAVAQEYPTKNIELIVPYGAGSSTDTVLRVVLDALSTSLGKQLVPTYVPGAGGAIGGERIARQTPDGYNIGIVASPHASFMFLRADNKADPVKDYTPICMIGRQPIVAIINPAFPAKNLKEFIAMARANPGKYNFVNHAGTVEMEFGAMIKLANLKMVGVPYRGGSQGVAGLLGNEVHIMATGAASAKPLMDAGRVRAIAITSSETFPGLVGFEHLPLMSEEVKGFKGNAAWYGLVGPAELPAPIVQKISDACVAALRNDQVKERLAKLTVVPAGGTPSELQDRIANDVNNMRVQVELTGIKPR